MTARSGPAPGWWETWLLPDATEPVGDTVAPVRDTVGAAVAAFLDAAEHGSVLDSDGSRYSRERLRDVRASLSHVDSELGSLPMRSIDSADVDRLLVDLRRAGLPPARLDAIVIALRALRGYAADEGLVGDRALPDPALTETGAGESPWVTLPPEPGYAEPEPRPGPTPTLELVATARRVATWTVRTILFVFAVLVVLLILEL